MRRALGQLVGTLRDVALRHRWWLIAVLVYGALAGLLLRDGFGGGSSILPQGTNALDSVLLYGYWSHYPLSTWLYPYTDWGVPVPGFTGPTPLLLGIVYLNPTTLVRLLEFLSIFGAGLSVFWVIKSLRGTGASALAAGVYYSLLAETPGFFEGHIPAMVSVAFAPVFFYLTFRFFQKPQARTGIPLALTLYFMAAVGDLGLLYFYLFFGIFVALYSLWKRNRTDRYTYPELLRIGSAFGLFVVLMLPWLVPYAQGVHPQYTTSITTTIVAFSNTSGQPFGYSFAGFVFDQSYVLYIHSQLTAALAVGVLWPLYIAIPIGISAFVIVQRQTGPRLFFLSAVLAMIFSTGGIYRYISTFNALAYDYVPFFNYDPSLFRWAVYVDLVFAVLLGMLLTDLERSGLRTWREFVQGIRRKSRPGEAGPADDSPPSQKIIPPRPSPGVAFSSVLSGGRRRRQVLVAVVMVAVCATVVTQNWLVVSEPPGLFEFPSAYLAGFQYITSAPVRGNILTIPFGADYEITPWGGLSGSTLLMTPYFTGVDSVMFQAGTPYSLEMDSFIGNGLTYGRSDNITKFLESANIQYVAATDYPDWSIPTSSVYVPQVSYDTLTRQTGLGTPVFQGGYQTVYSLPGYAGNVSVHSQYYVYFGSDALVYSILNQPWFNGSQPLIDGSALTFPADQPYLTHAAAIVTDPENISNLTPAQLVAVRTSGTPLIVLMNSLNTPFSGGAAVSNPWNSSNGQAFASTSIFRPIQLAVGTLTTSLLGSSTFNLTTRVECAPGAAVAFSLGSTALNSLIPDPISARESLPYNDTSLVSAGDNESGSSGYNGTLVSYQAHDVTFLNWSLSRYDPRFQYVDFDFSDLGSANGISVDVGSHGVNPIPLVLKVAYPDGTLTVPSYATGTEVGAGAFEYAFFLPQGSWAGAGPSPLSFGTNSRFLVGMLDENGTVRNMTFSNVSSFVGLASHFTLDSIGPATFGASNSLNVTAATGCNLDTIGLVPIPIDNPPAPGPLIRYLNNQPDPTDISVGPIPAGWELVVLAQSYSPYWSLTGSSGSAIHEPGDLGLNAWLINASSGTTLRFQYAGQSLQEEGIIAEAVALPSLLIVWFLFQRSRLRPRRPVSHQEGP